MSCLVVHFSEIYTDRLKMQRNNTVSYQYILLTLKLCSFNTFCIHIYIVQVHYSVNTKQKICLCQATKQCLLLNRTPGLHISLDIQLPDFLVEYEHLTTPL